MTKSDEKAFLRQVIRTLGRDSYCGEWLAEQLAAIEAAIDSDFPVHGRVLTLEEAKREAEAILRAAKDQAAVIEAEAKEQAEAIFRRAKSSIESEKERLRDSLRRALAGI